MVGSEWGSYAAPVSGSGARAGGSVARTALREAAEEAGEKLARQGAKELPPVVIGENMRERVVPYARRYGYQTIEDFIPERVWQEAFARGEAEALALNEMWIQQMMRQGRRIIDIGPSMKRRVFEGRPASQFYELERKLTKSYRLYQKAFHRFGRRAYGVPGLDL